MLSLFVTAALALPPVMPLDQVKAGQKGECLTVFEGNEVEPFPFVVKGVMRNFLGPKKHLVLIKLQGEKAEFTGVVAGMSGSPCSVEGQLVGALAYSFAMFAKEPIAGITPMSNMLDVMELPEEQRPWRLNAEDSEQDWKALREGRAPAPIATVAMEGARPIATPLAMGGVLPEIQAHFSPYFESHGFTPVAAGSSGEGAVKKPLKPGSAIAAVLIRGDLDVAATGTVTSVEGDKVLAFGHPFFGAGPVSIPMANAEIINTMVSQMRSFKRAVTGPIIGEVTQDRLTAIGGYLGRAPSMLKVDGEVKTPGGPQPFVFEVARDQELSPRFVAMGIANSLTGRVDAGERGTVRVHATITAAGHAPVTVKNVYAAERDKGLLIYPAVDVAQAFSMLWDTPFGPPPKLAVKVRAEVLPEPIEEWVESIHLDRAQARPGDAVEIAVRLRKRGGGIRLERFHVPVPHAWAGNEIDFVAAGASEVERLAKQLDGELMPNDLDDIVSWLSQRRSDGQLYLVASRRGPGMRAGVEVLPFLPGSVVATMSGDAGTDRRNRALAWEERRERPGIVSGMAPASLRVLSRD